MKRPEESVEWVQCEGPDCGKWRILPHTTRASALPERFECHMCHWNEEGASCDSPEDTVEGAHWLYPGGAAGYRGEACPGAVGGAAQSTEQMLLELESQANQMMHQKQQHNKKNKRRSSPKQPPQQQQRSLPQARLPKGAKLPSEAGDAAAYTDFAA